MECNTKRLKKRKAESKKRKQGESKMRAIPTEANETQGFATDACGSGRHLAYVLHALDARAFSQSLIEPSVSPVEVEDVAHGGVGRLLHSRRRDVAHGDACQRNARQINNHDNRTISTAIRRTDGRLKMII